MAKFRFRFSFVLRPFCCAITITDSPSSRAHPQITAGSSRNERSPCISIQSAKIRSIMSNEWGRWAWRAICTRSIGDSDLKVSARSSSSRASSFLSSLSTLSPL